MASHSDLANLIWQIADLLRGPYRPPQYERVMLPLVVLRRFDCVLADTKDKVLAEYARRKGGKLEDDALDRMLNKASGHRFHNRSPMRFQTMIGDTPNLARHLQSYISGFSANVRRIFDFFEFTNEIEKMDEANILYLVLKEFLKVDLHPDRVKNDQMGLVFENLIRRFNELANETAGDHFTPREVIHLMVDLLFMDADDVLSKPGTVMRMLDPACGTGGMLAEAQRYMRDHHKEAKLYVYGQDYNKRAFATAASDMLMKQVDHNGGGENVQYGDTFTDDKFEGQTFDYFIANPPFGVDWKKQQREIVRRHEKAPQDSPWSAGLPRVNDGSLLFLQHMISKFEEVDPKSQKYGSRAALVFSGSPLFTGGAGGGESNIRKWIIERDMLEAIVALPEQMFYNTGIGTYIWIVTNNKPGNRKGTIQLVDARDIWMPMGRSQGDKRRKIGAGCRHQCLEEPHADSGLADQSRDQRHAGTARPVDAGSAAVPSPFRRPLPACDGVDSRDEIALTVTPYADLAGLSQAPDLADVEFVPRLIHAGREQFGIVVELIIGAITRALAAGEAALSVKDFAHFYAERTGNVSGRNPFIVPDFRNVQTGRSALVAEPQVRRKRGR